MPATYPPEQLSFGQAVDFDLRRLLLGLWPGSCVADGLTRVDAQLRRDKILPGRLIDPDRAHVTTHHLSDFVGQMPPNLVPAAKMAAATVKMQPFDVTFDRAVGTGQQFLLRASDGSEALCSFQRSLTAALIAAGLRRYLRGNIRPHMTLSYGVNTVRERPVDPVRWTVQEFVLVESLVGAHRHIVLGRWPLQP